MKCYNCGMELSEKDKDEMYENIYRCPKCGNLNTIIGEE